MRKQPKVQNEGNLSHGSRCFPKAPESANLCPKDVDSHLPPWQNKQCILQGGLWVAAEYNSTPDVKDAIWSAGLSHPKLVLL